MTLWSALLGFALFLALGGLTQIAETFWPLREYVKPKAWRLDLIALAITLLTRVVMSRTEGPAIARLPELPGLSWTTAVAGAVTRNVPWPIVLLVSLVVLDGLLYFGHRLLHAPWLWHTHAAHHSVEHLYWLGGNRASPFHVASLGAWGLLLGLVWPTTGGSPALFLEAVIYMCIQHFNHANIRWRLGPVGWLLVTPRYHFVHHGSDSRWNGGNFGFLLTIWDRMFGTYVDPDRVPHDFPLGLDYKVGVGRMLLGLPPRADRGQVA